MSESNTKLMSEFKKWNLDLRYKKMSILDISTYYSFTLDIVDNILQ